MSRHPSFIKLTEKEIDDLDLSLRSAVKEGRLRYRRRLQIIWFSNEGLSVERIAERLDVSEQIVWKCRRIYKEKGLAGLKGKYFSHKL